MKPRRAYVSRSLSQTGITLKLPVGTRSGDSKREVEIRVIGDGANTPTVIEALREPATAGRIRVIPSTDIGDTSRREPNVGVCVGFLGFIDADNSWAPVY